MERMACSDPSNVIDLGDFLTGSLVRSGEFLVLRESNVVTAFDSHVCQVTSIEEMQDVEENETVIERGMRRRARTTRREMAAAQPSRSTSPETTHTETAEGRLFDRTRVVLVRHLEVKTFPSTSLDQSKCKHVHQRTKEAIVACVVEWIPLSRIRDASIGFVCHLDSTQNGEHPWHSGMENTFFVRRKKDQNGAIIDLECNDFNPFWSPCGSDVETHSKRIANTVAAVNELTSRALTDSKATWMQRSKHIHIVGGNCESFQCLCGVSKRKMALRKQTAIMDSFVERRCKKRMNPDLSVSNRKRKICTTLFRVVHEDDLDDVRSVVGATFGVGVTKDAPTMKTMRDKQKAGLSVSDTVKLDNHDMVRIVTCRENDIDAEASKDRDAATDTVFDRSRPQKKRLVYPGCDLRFVAKEGLTDLHIGFIFKKLPGNSGTVRKAQRGGALSPENAGDVAVGAADDSAASVAVNADFRCRNDMCVVKEVDKEKGTIKCSPNWEDSDAECDTMDTLAVEALVKQCRSH